MKTLVTGGAGFIGSELVRQLADKVDHITVIDNLVNGRTENLDGLSPKKFQLVVEDIRNSARMLELMQGVQTVFHLACLGVRHSIHSPRENHEVNATATLDLLAAARKARIRPTKVGSRPISSLSVPTKPAGSRRCRYAKATRPKPARRFSAC